MNGENQKLVVVEKPTLPEVKVNPEINVETTMSSLCESSLIERTALTKVYEDIMSSEITPELAKRAKRCMLDMVSARSKITKSGKAERAYSVAYQKLVITWVDKETLPFSNMEPKLLEIVNHQENLDAEAKAIIATERMQELEKYEKYNVPGLGDMDEDVYKSLLKGSKVEFEEKQEEIKKALEAKAEEERKQKLYTTRKTELMEYKAFCNITDLELETSEEDYILMLDEAQQAKEVFDKKQKEVSRKADLYISRKELILPFSQFCMIDQLNSETTNDEFATMKLNAESKKRDYDKKQEETRLENERIKKESKIKDKRNEELRPFIMFIRDYSKMLALGEKEYIKEFNEIKLGAQQHYEYEEKERLKELDIELAKQREIEKIHLKKEKDLADERAKNKLIADELQAKKDAEIKAKEEQEEKARAEALAPDKTKMLKLIEELNLEIPELKSKESAEIMSKVLHEFQGFRANAVQIINQHK